MNTEEIQEIKTEARVDFIGEQLTQEVYRGVSLNRIMQNIIERVESLEARYKAGYKDKTYEMRNELTYLHNEVNELQELHGMHGEIPKKEMKGKYEYF